MNQGQPQRQDRQCLDPTKLFKPVPNKYYRILSAKNPNYVLDCSRAFMDRNMLIIWPQHTGANQMWQVRANQDGTFCLKSAQNGYLLTVAGNAPSGSQCYISAENGSIYEKWRITPSEGELKFGGWTISTVLNGLVLDIKNNKVTDSSSVILWANKAEDNENQTWIISPVEGDVK